MARPLRLASSLFIALVCAGCDQAAKRVAEATLAGAAPISYLDGAVRFELITNRGGFLSLGADLPDEIRVPLFLLGVPLLLGGLLVWQIASGDLPRLQAAGLALVLGGGVGNLIDRVTNHGEVVDFVSIGLGPLRTGIFNVADVTIMAGAGLALLASRPVNPQRRSD